MHSIDPKSYQNVIHHTGLSRRYSRVMKPTKDFRFDLHNVVFEPSLTEILPFHARHNRSLRHNVAMSSTVHVVSHHENLFPPRVHPLSIDLYRRLRKAAFYYKARSHMDFLSVQVEDESLELDK